MNKSNYLANLLNTYDRVGIPKIAVDTEADIAARAELGQTFYKVTVEQINDTVGKTGNHLFYVYDEGTPEEKAVAFDKEPAKLIPDAPIVSTFEQEAIQWFVANKGAAIRKFGTNEVISEIEMIRFRCLALDDQTNEMSEHMQVVWKEDGVWFQAKYNGTYNV